MGFDVLYLPPIHPIGRERRKGRNNTLDAPARATSAARGRSARPRAATRRSIPQLGTLEDFRRLVARARDARHRDRARHRVPVLARPSLRRASIRSGSAGGPTARSSTPRIRRRSTRTSIRSTSSPTTGRRCGSELAERLRVLDRRGRAHLPRRQSAHQAVPVLGVGDRRGQARASRRDLPRRGVHAAEGDAPARQARLHAVVHLLHVAQHEAGARPSTSPSCTHGPGRDYFRPNCWPNTPDILPEYLQFGGRAGVHGAPGARGDARRRTTASTAPPSSCSSTAARARQRGVPRLGEVPAARTGTSARADSLAEFIARVNAARRDNPALQRDARPALPPDRQRRARSATRKVDARRRATPCWSSSTSIPHHAQSGWVDARPRRARRRRRARPFQVHDLLTGARYLWRGARNFVQLDPARVARARLPACAAAFAPSATSTTSSEERRWPDHRRRRRVAAPRARSPRRRTACSGTRTRSSTSCTSRRSSTATTTASATSAASPQKLDYIQDLGVNTIWLLPFYPSPLRDDGYDIADYRNVHPAYGTRADFQQFVREAHRRGPARDHRARHQPHVRPAPVVPGGAARADGLAEARLLRLERRSRHVRRHAHHLHRHREVELDVGRGREGVLLAPLLQPPAGPELRQPAGAEGGHPRDALLARHGRGRLPARRDSRTCASARAPTTRTCPRRTRC